MKNTKYLVRNQITGDLYECKNPSEVSAALWGRLHQSDVYKRVDAGSELNVTAIGEKARKFGEKSKNE